MSRAVRGASILLPAAAILLGAAAARAAPAPPAARPAAAPSVHLEPRAQAASSYTLDAHFDVLTKDVSFEAPPAYKESFEFWSARMKGNRRMELYQFVTLTDEAAADRMVHFRRILSRFQVDLERNGETMAPQSMVTKDMTSQAWEGTLDRLGNTKEVRRTGGEDTGDMAELATPYVMEIFPVIDAPHDLKVGDTLHTSVVLPLPSRLHVDGLQGTRVLVTRELTLKQVSGDLAKFEVKTTYANAPAAEGKGAAGGATCAISGGGTGDADFDLKRGVFLASQQPGTMKLEITAPLRPLPEHPETEHAGMGTTRIELQIKISGSLVVHRIVGED